MKKLFTLSLIAALTFSVFAQAPQRLSYQAVIRNSSGGLVVTHAVGMKISILQGSASGTAVYVETHTTTTNANGLATIEIGGGSVVSGTFAGINWGSGTYYLKTETDPAGGTSYSVSGTSQLLSVPYAIYARSVESISETDPTWNGAANETTVIGRTGWVGIGITTPAALLHTLGTGTGEGNVIFIGEYKSSNPGTPPVSGAGTRMMWYADKAAFRAGYVSGSQWDYTNIGDCSTAIGARNTASGWGSTAMGEFTTASRIASTAMGYGTTASGDCSIAMGRSTTASGYASTALGRYNVGGGNVSTWVATDPLFEIGNGSSDAVRHNAMTVLKNGNIGIGTPTPAALLHTQGTGTGEGNVVFIGELKSSSPGDPPVSGAGTRMMWYPDKASFRAGRVMTTQWDNANIGDLSTAMGFSTIASGECSTSLGEFTTASRIASTAMGYYTNASGDGSTAMGVHTSATGYASTAIGRYNIGGGDTYTWVVTDPLFEIGNGSSDTQRSNALTVLKSGRVGIVTSSPSAGLHLKGTGYPASFMFLQADAGQDAGFRLYEGTTPKWHIFNDAGLGGFLIYNDAGITAIFCQQSNSFVGIGTTSPAYKFDVNGNIRATGSVYYGGTTGNANGTAYIKPDYVFEDHYKMLQTEEVEEYLKKENHLPWITSVEKEKQDNGDVINMTRMAFETVESIENLQLQIIEQKKLLNKIINENDQLRSENENITSRLEKLEKRINFSANK